MCIQGVQRDPMLELHKYHYLCTNDPTDYFQLILNSILIVFIIRNFIRRKFVCFAFELIFVHELIFVSLPFVAVIVVFWNSRTATNNNRQYSDQSTQFEKNFIHFF